MDHEASHDVDGVPPQCKHCGLLFPNIIELDDHMIAHEYQDAIRRAENFGVVSHTPSKRQRQDDLEILPTVRPKEKELVEDAPEEQEEEEGPVFEERFQ